MVRLLGIVLVWAALGLAAVPTPREHLGYDPGADYKLAGYDDVIGYFRKLEKSSTRIVLEEFGKSAEGKPMIVAYISSEANLKELPRWKETSRKLALGQATADEAAILAQSGKVIVWIDSGLHATEVAPVQHSFDLAYRMVTAEDAETRAIRDSVILMQVPVINPDGLDWVASWYRSNVGTQHELAPLPRLYQKYAGHDNNRDYFMLNLEETRHVSRMLFREWFPQIVYNQHQTGPFPSRIFVPPYAEPLNPNIPAAVMEGINVIGGAMKERFARENKPGVLSYHGYDAWWNGGLRSVPAFHNMHGILTETALFSYATPGEYRLSDIPNRFANGIPTKEPSVFYQRPWMGGVWRIRDAVDYMLTADFAILELAASRRAHFLAKAYDMARQQMEAGNRGTPYAYIVPARQWDPTSAADMVRRLAWSGIEVHRAAAPFSVGPKQYGAGSLVLRAGQPFRAHLVDLLEPQKYPELRTGSDGPTKRPYDVAGWTLSMSMGVEVDRVDGVFEARLERSAEVSLPQPSRDHKDNGSFLWLARTLAIESVRWSKSGEMLTSSDAEAFRAAAYEIRKPRVALYEPWSPNMDAGWTQYVLDQFELSPTIVHNADFKSNLRERFDTIILASQSPQSILHGVRAGEASADRAGGGEGKAFQRPEYTGGIGLDGLAALDRFVRDGGTLIAFDTATELPIQYFPLPLRTTNGNSSGYYSPGSLIRIDVDTAHPLAFGMPRHPHAFTTGGQAWEITLQPPFNQGDREVRSAVRYASSNVLASGWMTGERAVAGKHALVEAKHGKGRVVLFGFRPQFRGQTAGTFKFLLNAIYLASARAL